MCQRDEVRCVKVFHIYITSKSFAPNSVPEAPSSHRARETNNTQSLRASRRSAGERGALRTPRYHVARAEMALAVSVPARWQARVPPRVTRRDQRVDKKRSSSSARATRGSPSSPSEADASDEASAPASASAPSCFFAGVGVGDCTGPMDGVGMMGYARVSQISSGLRQRQKARAFVVAETRPSFLDRVVRTCTTYADDAVLKEEVDKNDGHDPTNASTSTSTSIVALVVVDACMVFPDLKAVVARRVAERIEIEFGLEPRDAAAVFDQDNLCVCATHTHSAPGGYAPHGLYNVTFGGAISESFDALARGAAEALFEAFADAFRAETKTRTVGFARGELVGVSANRSRSAFDLNPEIETAPFACSGGVDETVSALVIGSSSKIENRVRGAGGFEAPAASPRGTPCTARPSPARTRSSAGTTKA